MNKTEIVGDWIHAHERDGDGARLFVSAEETLPPSRGRQRLVFRYDGSFVEGRPGPDDKKVSASGTYSFDDKQLVLNRSGSTQADRYEAVVGAGGKTLKLLKR